MHMKIRPYTNVGRKDIFINNTYKMLIESYNLKIKKNTFKYKGRKLCT